MKDNIVVVLLLVLIGILSGFALLFGINNAVQVAMSPVAERLNEIRVIDHGIQQKLASDSAQLNQRLSALENKLSQIENKISAAPSAPQPQQPPQPPSEDLDKVYTIPVGNSMIVGKKDAPITITQFTDLQCPFCARFYPPVKETLKAYPDKVNYLIKHYPLSFHPNARPAAKVALAAGAQGKYIEMVELLLNNGADVSEPKLKEYAKTLKLNEKKLLNDIKNNDATYEANIKADLDLGGQVDVRGTPTFYINGKKTNARDAASFKTEIDKILAQK